MMSCRLALAMIVAFYFLILFQMHENPCGFKRMKPPDSEGLSSEAPKAEATAVVCVLQRHQQELASIKDQLGALKAQVLATASPPSRTRSPNRALPQPRVLQSVDNQLNCGEKPHGGELPQSSPPACKPKDEPGLGGEVVEQGIRSGMLDGIGDSFGENDVVEVVDAADEAASERERCVCRMERAESRVDGATDAGAGDADRSKSEVDRLLREREELLSTGIYTEQDELIVRLGQRIHALVNGA